MNTGRDYVEIGTWVGSMHSPYWSDTEIWQARYEIACQGYTKGEVSRDLFKATLYRLGFRGQAIEAEVNLHYPQRPQGGNFTRPEGEIR